MLDDFMVRATLAGIGVAIAAAPLGCFVAVSYTHLTLPTKA